MAKNVGLNPVLNPQAKRKTLFPGFAPRNRAISAFVTTPTGNGTQLGIARHILAGRARRLLPRTACRSLRFPSFGPQPTFEPSSEPWLECRPRGPVEPFSWGEPPKPTRSLWYIYRRVFYYHKRGGYSLAENHLSIIPRTPFALVFMAFYILQNPRNTHATR